MSEEINLTPQPITLTALGKQSLSQAVDVSDLNRLDLVCTVLALAGANVTIRIIGGMQRDTESGWVEIATFGVQSAVGPALAVTVGLLKYVRWELVQATGLTSVTFVVQGMGHEG